MGEPRVPLYDRLPAIYRIRDATQSPPGQLKAFLALIERELDEVYGDVEALYHDLFVDTCADWVVPYLADLVGTSHLAGDPWTVRADVADTIPLRRRKGTLAAVERAAFDLSGWAVHAVELRRNLLWSQHLNHQRPDAGGAPPLSSPAVTLRDPVRGGTVTLRDPAALALLGTSFDPFGHHPDLRPPDGAGLRYNLPNLALFLWRLAAYTVPAAPPVPWPSRIDTGAATPLAAHVARFYVHPLGRPVSLFNTHRFDPDARPPVVSDIDATPGPMPRARLTSDAPAGRHASYVAISLYDPGDPTSLERGEVGLVLHLPRARFAGVPADRWRFRGANLCAWEVPLEPPLREYEVAIDPRIGRLAIGTADPDEADDLLALLRVGYTYGAVGPIGAHPVGRDDSQVAPIRVPLDAATIEDALADAATDRDQPIVVEIVDSGLYSFDCGAVAGATDDGSGPSMRLGGTVILRAADGQRPIVELTRSLRARPAEVVGATPEEQARIDARNAGLRLRLERLYLTRGPDLDAAQPLIARAAVNSLELVGCALDPGGWAQANGDRVPVNVAIDLRDGYGFGTADETEAFDEVPELHLRRTITGAMRVDRGYRIFATDSIVDAGTGPGTPVADTGFALAAASGDPATGWAAPLQVQGVTAFGRIRAERCWGTGAIVTAPLEVLDDQHGCLKYSYFAPAGNRLPQHFACVSGADARLIFTSEAFEQPGYAQLDTGTDWRIRERGPGDDAMGVTGFLLEAHRWRNMRIRVRELIPVGTRPLFIPVT